MTDALKTSLDRVAGRTCGSCGFFDPEALEDDPDLIEKMVDALNGGKPFKCHEAFPQAPTGHFMPTIAQQIAAPLCAGFAALKAELEKRGETFGTNRQKAQLCLEILRRGRLAPCIPSRG